MKFLFGNLIPAFAFVLLFAGFAFAQETETEKGIEFYQKGEYQKAVETLQKVVEANKENQELWLYLGMSFAKLKKDKEAVAAFNKATEFPAEELKENEKAFKITAKPYCPFTDSARKNQVQGTIALGVEFGADGTIGFIFPFRTLPDGLTENAVEVARKIKFEPAMRNGKPVSTIKIIKYSFAIY